MGSNGTTICAIWRCSTTLAEGGSWLSKLLALITDPNKKALLEIKLTAVVDWGAPLLRPHTHWKAMVDWQWSVMR